MNKMDDMKTQEDFKLEAMKAMGWNIGADIPMANEENLQILKEMEEMTELKFRLHEQCKAYDERDKAIQLHKKNIEATLKQNLCLYNTIKNDLAKENHLFKLKHLERCKINEDLRKNQKEYEEFVDYKERIENKICISKNEIDELTSRIKSAKTALLDWNEAMEDSNKGYELIDKYYKDDQYRAHELNVRRQNLQAEIDKKRKAVIRIYDEQNTLEKNLERTATLYRTAHIERRQMVDTWKSAVNQMTQRENDIQNGEKDYIAIKEESEQMEQQYKRYNYLLNEVIENNRQVEAAIEELNNETSDIKENMQRLTDFRYLKQRETESLQKELSNLANRVEQQRGENCLHKEEKLNKEQEIEHFDGIIKKIEDRLKAMENKNLSASQRLKILEDMNDAEQRSLSDLAKETERVNALLYRTMKQITQMKDEQKILMVNNDSLNSTLSALKRNTKNIENELKRQTEIHYDLAFKYLEAERRLAVLRGNVIDPEIEARNQAMLNELEQKFEKLQRRLQSTEAQNKKLNYTMNALVNAYNNDNKVLDTVKFKIKEATVYCEGSVKRLKSNRFQNQELIVELSLFKMRCNDLEVEIEKCEKGTFTLEQHRLHVQRSAKDRSIELKGQQDLLLLKRKHLMDELSTLRADLGDRKKHIEAMRARFELSSKLLGTNDDGTMVTTTQLKVANAQEKQLLAEEGDELNKKVLQAEQEIVALENTLRQFDKSNDNYRKSLQKTVTDNTAQDKMADELKQLELQYCQELNRLKMLRCKVHRKELHLEELIKSNDQFEKQHKAAINKRTEHADILEKLLKEIDVQNTKILRAEREIKLVLKNIKESPISSEFLEMFNRDLDLQELEQRNMRALNQLADMALSDQNGTEIIDILIRKGLKMPQHLKRSRSCVSWRSESSLDSRVQRNSCTSSISNDLQSVGGESVASHVSIVSLELPPVLERKKQ